MNLALVRKGAFVGPLLVAAVCALVTMKSPSQQQATNKLAEQLLIDMRSESQPAKREAARISFRLLGTNGLPSLLKLISYKASKQRLWLEYYSRNFPVVITPVAVEQQKRKDALQGFLALGESGIPAMTALERMLVNETNVDAGLALGAIGTNAIPKLVNALSKHDENIQIAAITGLVLVCCSNCRIHDGAVVEPVDRKDTEKIVAELLRIADSETNRVVRSRARFAVEHLVKGSASNDPK